MIYKYNRNNPYEIKKHNLLVELGFKKRIEGGLETFQYEHDLLPIFDLNGKLGYDFTANSIEGIVKIIYEIGYKRGKEDKLKEIKNILEIK